MALGNVVSHTIACDMMAHEKAQYFTEGMPWPHAGHICPALT